MSSNSSGSSPFATTQVSVVIPVYNKLEYTKICLESLRTHEQGIGEIIIIDNASTDGTNEYLSHVTGYSIIENVKNLGCAKAWNQGIDASSSEWVLFLNNDVIVTSGWLTGMLEFAEREELDIVSPAIREGECNYNIHEYARNFVTRMSRHARLGVADGICFLVRQRVIAKIGRFDENFRIGQFEDTDFFRRAALAGFRLGTTGRSFIHHFGSITQNYIRKSEGENSYQIDNRAYFRKKWNLSWYRRFAMRTHSKARRFYWRTKERLISGHSLKEKWINGRLKFF